MRLEKYYKIFILLLIITSCSTSRKQIISLDSGPRNAKFYVLPENRYIGKSPFFYRFRLGEMLKLRVEYLNHKHKFSSWEGSVFLKDSCHITTKQSLMKKFSLDNFLNNTVGKVPVLGYLKRPFDYFMSTRFECFPQVRLKLDKKVKDRDICRKYLVIPPINSYPTISHQLIKNWKERNFETNRNSCDSMVNVYQSEVLLNFLGISHLSRVYGMKFISSQEIAQIGYKFGNTHFVFLNYEKNGNEYEVKPKIIDIHSKKEFKSKLNTQYTVTIYSDWKKKVMGFIYNTFRFIPNTLNFKMDYHKRIGLRSESRVQDGVTSKYILGTPSPRVSSLDYPFYKWGFNLRFSPSLAFPTWEEEYRMAMVNLVIAAKTVFHTPIGAFMFRAGWGAGHYQAQNPNTRYDKSGFTTVTHFRLGYYIFISRNWYLMTDVNRFLYPENTIRDGDFHLRHITVTSFRIGRFFPEMKIHLRKLFGGDYF